MEVHPPHSPIHSVKEFMIHILAITIGLLLALGLDSTVEWLHHRHLAREARENIFAEIRSNQRNVLGHLRAMPEEQKRLQVILAAVDDLQNKRPSKPLGDFNWTFNIPAESAWNSTASSGAITYMKYDEIRRYSQLYDFQKIYNSYAERYLQERHDMNVMLTRLQAQGKLSDAEFEEGKRNIQSEIMRTLELQEIDNDLNNAYSNILSRKN